ncbi:hypothetical protein GYA13_04530 [Candidatus Kuenenbacteria bacterium]|nr:hypothetical protein [Candidatus Kuenenbacteria bacterium]
MEFPKNFQLKPGNILKIAGLILVAIVIVALAFRLIGSAVSSLSHKTTFGNLALQTAPTYDLASERYSASSGSGYSSGAIGLSTRNVASSPSIKPSATVGDNAEEFEVTEYNALIETRQLKNTCDAVAALKERPDVIFENASQYEHSCNYTFKVKHDSAPEILAIISALNPRELNENIYTLKNQIDDYTSAVEILEKKMTAIDETLANAVKSYDDISALATRTQDVESLAKIIDSKINLIERLTQERLNISTQLEQLARRKSEQLDRLDYTYFYVNVSENKFIDGQSLKDSWRAAVREFVDDINSIIQAITINLIALVLRVLQYILYLLIILVVAKYVWRFAKAIWRKK